MPAWSYLENGGKHAELIWHRRSGKDEISLHRTACAAFERPATYWHMLPEAAQARKAIWEAVNPHSGIRRIDEAFPHEIRATTREQEMLIKFKNGSTWQVVGSDNFNSLVGSPPAGVVYSEWALANPAARAYLRPILLENGGWQIFITTPRGKNHAYTTFNAAIRTPGSFAQKLSAWETGTLSREALESELQAYIDDFGEDAGRALFQQEYECSFDAAILGAIYGAQMQRVEAEGRITSVPVDPAVPVHTAWDLGRSDHTAIWFYQVVRGEIHVVDFHRSNLKDADFYGELLREKEFKDNYGHHWLPHDAKAKTLAAKGKSFEEQIAAYVGWSKIRIVPNLSIQDGIKAVRKMLPRTWFDDRCDRENGIEALKQYRYEYDQEKKCFADRAVHDWTSHPADAFRMLGVAWQEEQPKQQPEQPKWPSQMTINELIKRQRAKRDE